MIIKRTIIVLLAIISLILFSSDRAMAHPGRTDSSGGHTCRTNCPSWGLDWGEYHYHNGGGGGESSGGLSEAAQARIAGAEFASNERRAAIESSASVEGRTQGSEDGSNGKSEIYGKNDSDQHCSQIVKFTNTPTETFREAFQTVYTRTCVGIYDTAYRTAYKTANESAVQSYEENNKRVAEAQKLTDAEEQENSRRWGLAAVGGFIGIPVIGAFWGSIKEWWAKLD